MAMHETQGLTGRLTIELRNMEGQLVTRRHHDNLITSAGKTLVAQLFTGELNGKPDLTIAVGDSPELVKASDTKLGNQLDAVVATTTAIQMSQLASIQRAVATVKAAFPALAADKIQVLREAGIVMRFPNQPAVLYNRVNFAEITRTGNLEMTLTWEVIF